MPRHRHGRAVVLGGSLAGLLTARVLSETFERVTVLDRDVLPATPTPRRGVSQSAQPHPLLARGWAVLDDLFPRLRDELIDLGATAGDVQDAIRWWVDGKPLQPGHSGLAVLAVGRPLLEFVLRRRVAALPTVSIVGGRTVTDLLASADGSRVLGVVAEAGGVPVTFEEVDLVVDATGRGSRSRRWLTELGYPPVTADEVGVKLTYVSRRYRREPGQRFTVVSAYPGQPRSAFLLPQDNNTVILSLHGWFGAVPPEDDEGMAAFADELAAPDPAALIRGGRPLGGPVTTRFPASVRLRYELMPRFPAGFLVVGDALCSLNPFYAQGVSVAALEADALRRILASGDDVRGFFTEAARILDGPWSIVAGSDLRHPEATGDRSMFGPRLTARMASLRAGVVGDPALATAYLRVGQLEDPPAALFA